MDALATNVAANTNVPGFRGPIYPGGRFTYVLIPASEVTGGPVPTCDVLASADFGGPDLLFEVSAEVREKPVHLDPEFATYPDYERYIYGDEHGVKARPISELSAGDVLLFYATLELSDPAASADWITPDWGSCLTGHFRLACDPVTGDEYEELPGEHRDLFANNTHVKRADVDTRVFVHGDPAESRLYDLVIPLSERTTGSDPNRLVTDLSVDSGRGPWWRRPLRFESAAADSLLSVVENRAIEDCFAD